MLQLHAVFGALSTFNLQTPPEGAMVSLHYVGKFADTGKEFESSYTRGQPFSFNIGEGRVIKGWDVAVRTMKKGEQCIIILTSDYGYGNSVSSTIPVLIYDLAFNGVALDS